MRANSPQGEGTAVTKTDVPMPQMVASAPSQATATDEKDVPIPQTVSSTPNQTTTSEPTPPGGPANYVQHKVIFYLGRLKDRDCDTKTYLQRLDVLSGRLGKKRSNDTTEVISTTVLAMFDIKAFISKPDLPRAIPEFIDRVYKLLVAKIQWRFSDAHEAINFLSAHGRCDIFATTRISNINITAVLHSNRDCCRDANRESEKLHCELGGCLVCENTTPGPSLLFSANKEKDVDRPPCYHASLDRIFLLLAARIRGRGGFEEASPAETITRIRRQMVTAWRDVQFRNGWAFAGGDTDFPPPERNQPARLTCEEGQKVNFHLYLSKKKDGSPDVLTYSFMGQLTSLI